MSARCYCASFVVKFTLFLLLQENQAFQLYVTVAYPDHSHLLFVVFILYIQLNSECIITQKFIVNVLNDQSLSKYFDSLHVVVRFGCGVSLVGYMSGRDTAQSLGCWQVVALMALSVCYINELLRLF